LRDPDRPEDITPEQARLLGYLEQSLRAQFLYKRNKEYLVQGGKVIIVDEFTGRLMPGRRWSDGLHQAVEAKEGVKVQSESVTYATITIQNYFRMYEKLAGMTGTALTEAEEFSEIYSLDVLAIPTNLEYQASRPETNLLELEERDEEGYKFYYYSLGDDPDQKPIFWKRKDYPDVVYRTEEAKLRAIVTEIIRFHALGRPILLGTTSVELSERISNRLKADSVRRLAQVILLRENWMRENQREQDGRQILELEFLNEKLGNLDKAQMRKMARELDMSFNPEDPANVNYLSEVLNIPESKNMRLLNDIKGGVPHQVLNARKHTEESQIIAGAGGFGGVTIATNMAGRGVDIKLGGEIAEEILSSVNRILKRGGYVDAFDMTMKERQAALKDLDPSQFGIYDTEINYFLKYIDEMEQVRELGGLHVIGSERHEARRIDNQLRGRAARQGDPGSSRFYLSMEDELMRLFGGEQADSLMQRMKIDDAIPLEVGLVSRLVEQSQNRVEGANFDIRKHLLEYDDVLNSQRAKIYALRNRIFTKTDLTEDVTEMLSVEVNRRVPEALENDSRPWQLLSWLDQIQPAITVNGLMFPPYSLKLLIDHTVNTLDTGSDPDEARQMILSVVENSIITEKEHIIETVDQLLFQTQERIDHQLAEKVDLLETFLDGLSNMDESEIPEPAVITSELTSLLHTQISLSKEQQRLLHEDTELLEEEIQEKLKSTITKLGIIRLIGAIERRIDEGLDINVDQLPMDDWNSISDIFISEIERVYNIRIERYIGDSGQVTKDLDKALSRHKDTYNQQVYLQILLSLQQGARASFDRKTHKRIWHRTTRYTYFYYVSSFLENREQTVIIEDVLNHLQNARVFMRKIWGQSEYSMLESSTVGALPAIVKSSFEGALVESSSGVDENQLIRELPQDPRETLVDELGKHALNEIYRQLLLSIISELWVEYLTQMEALRVTIGLEAYGQRDPLVQYKNRAYGLFDELLNNMRLSVVSRMFTYRPKDFNRTKPAQSRGDVQVEDVQKTSEPGHQISNTSEVDQNQGQHEAVPPVEKPSGKRISRSSKRRRRRKKK
jgi:preprotein translocase subunit SecA